jgi:hypothetical protein
MREVTVNKSELREKLVKNREQHREIFEEALAGFQREAIRLLEEQLERARHGVKRTISVRLLCPEDHTADYDRVLAMLDMEVGDEVVLTEQEFAQFVQDDWSWQHEWLASSARFSEAASRRLEDSYGQQEEWSE